MIPRSLSALLLCSLTMACTMEGAPPPAARPAPAPQAAIMPLAPTPSARLTDSSSTTTTTVQGNTTRTETSSSSVSVDASALLGALSGALSGGAAPAGNTAADYSGTWRVTSPGNTECRLNLQTPSNPAAQAMVQNMGCFNDLLNISRWSLRGNDLVLSDAFGNVNITLRATARNRLDGAGVTMWR